MATRKKLVDASALEARVAADPRKARWSALQQFLRDSDDPRGANQLWGEPSAGEKARVALLSALFGPKHATVMQRFQEARSRWHGPYLDEVVYYRRSENERLESEVVQLFLASPATALLRRLTIGHSEPTPAMAKILATLPDRPLARSLRSLVLTTEMPYVGKREIDLSPLARLPVLDELAIAAPLHRPKFHRGLAERLLTLSLAPHGAAAVRTLFPAAGYPRLRDLSVELTEPDAAPIFSGRATPALEILRVTGTTDREAVVDMLATSALLPRLRELHLEASEHQWQKGIKYSPAKLGRAFAHLERVVVRKGSVWTT